MPVVFGLAFDDENIDKLWVHGITERRAAQILENDHIIAANRENRRAPYLLIGRDHGGAFISLAIEPTIEGEVWRPVTGWPSKDSEIAAFLKRRSRQQ